MQAFDLFMITPDEYDHQQLMRKKFQSFNRHQEIAFKRLSKDTIASSTNVTTCCYMGCHKESYGKYGIEFLYGTKEV